MKSTIEIPQANFVSANVEFPSPSFEDASLLENDGDYYQNLDTIEWTCSYVLNLKNNASVPIKLTSFNVEAIYEYWKTGHHSEAVTDTFQINGNYDPSPQVIQPNGGEIQITVPLVRIKSIEPGYGLALKCDIQFEPDGSLEASLFTGLHN